MKRITKGNAPDFWSSYIRQNPNHKYADLDRTAEGRAVRNELREHLAKGQMNICCYCCCQLSPDKTHNEHIKPESKYDQLTMDYENIVASCTRGKNASRFTCGMKKDNDYDENLFVSPLEENCANHFIFYSNGSIDSDTDQGKYTIKLLGLQESKSLRESRKSQYDSVYTTCSGMVIDLCQDISSMNGDDYEAAKEMYQGFFAEMIIPTYFSDNDEQLPAYVDMLDYFKGNGEFDFDNIVTDLVVSGKLHFVSD